MSPFAVKSGFPDVSGCNKYHEWLNKWLVLVGLIVLTSFCCFVCDSIDYQIFFPQTLVLQINLEE